MEHITLNIFGLFIIATIVSMIGRFIRIPYTIALVLCGLLLGLLGLMPDVRLDHQLLFLIFLPPILFDAGINIDLKMLKKQWLSITVFALLGTIVSTLLVGGAVHYFLSVPLLTALLFGAIIAPTDPISVLSIFKDLNTNKNLSNLIEAESLFNDGIAVVLYIVISNLLTDQGVTLSTGIIIFLKTLIGGALVGLLIGAVASRITREFDDHLVEIMLTTVVAFGAYLAAENFHVSGVFAVIVAGLVVGNYGMSRGMSPLTQTAVSSFWEYIAFAVNSIVFILIGLEESHLTTGFTLLPVVVAIAAVLCSRAVAIYGLSELLNIMGQAISWPWRHIQVWSGLRGALSMAMVLGLDPALPYRGLLIKMTFAVVLFSLIVQGLSIKPLLRYLGLSQSQEN